MNTLKFIIIFFLLNQPIKAQNLEFKVNKIRTEEIDSTYHLVNINLEINGILLDSINRIKLIENAIATNNDSKHISDWFYSDHYNDNYDNKYTIVFDSINKNISEFQNIKGRMRYFYPSKERNSIVEITNGTSKFNKNLLEKNPTKIKVVFIDAKKLDKIRSKKRKLNKYLSELIKVNKLSEPLVNQTFEKYFRNRDEFQVSKEIMKNFIFYIEHSELRVNKILIIDKKTNKKGYISFQINSSDSSIWELRSFNNVPFDDIEIELIFENFESITNFDFELKDIIIK